MYVGEKKGEGEEVYFVIQVRYTTFLSACQLLNKVNVKSFWEDFMPHIYKVCSSIETHPKQQNESKIRN
jgi:hypothetical protein